MMTSTHPALASLGPALLLLALAACAPEPSTDESCEDGDAICELDFSLPDQDGATFTLSEQRGHPVLIQVTTLWVSMSSGPVTAAMAQLAEEVPELVVVDLLVEDASAEEPNQEDAMSWADAYPGTQVVYDPEGELLASWGLDEGEFPLMVLIDAEGQLAHQEATAPDLEELRSWIEAL